MQPATVQERLELNSTEEKKGVRVTKCDKERVGGERGGEG